MRLTRTKAALARYDRLLEWSLANRNPEETEAEFWKRYGIVEKAARHVGVVYGQETRGINNPETCAQCVRPGPFVRRLVKRYG